MDSLGPLEALDSHGDGLPLNCHLRQKGGGGAEVSNQQRGCSSGSICIKGDRKKHIHEVSSSIGTNKE